MVYEVKITKKYVYKTFSVYSSSSSPGLSDYKEICRKIKRQIKRPSPYIVPVYDFKEMPEHGLTYQYKMKRLQKLSKKEIIDFDNFYDDPMKCKNKKLRKFLSHIQKSYYDIHDGNIMKDGPENYKLIDLEGFVAL